MRFLLSSVGLAGASSNVRGRAIRFNSTGPRTNKPHVDNAVGWTPKPGQPINESATHRTADSHTGRRVWPWEFPRGVAGTRRRSSGRREPRSSPIIAARRGIISVAIRRPWGRTALERGGARASPLASSGLPPTWTRCQPATRRRARRRLDVRFRWVQRTWRPTCGALPPAGRRLLNHPPRPRAAGRGSNDRRRLSYW